MTKPEKGSSRLRKHRWSEAGSYYFITSSCFDKKPLFSSPTAFRILSDSLDWMEAEKRWEWLCFMVMPDHLHLVFILGANSSLSQVMKSYKSFTGRELKRELNLGHPAWQEQYFERKVRTEDELRKIVEYCYLNPFRKGLVKAPKDYPFWRCKFPME